MTIKTRPPKWDVWLPENERQPDEAWEAVPDQDWKIDTDGKCRRGTPKNGYCRRPSVAALNRSRSRPRWYRYCEKHLYNRWIENGRVLVWHIKREYQ